MKHEIHITRNHGHPWTGQDGWDLLEAKATSESELDRLIKTAECKFWHTWLRDNTGQITVVMYKPSGAEREWEDKPMYNGKEAKIIWL